ncbi:MAG: tRNA (N(6)-L-threonylcarbamoyladenosine(37)-C(2))-methylthiotransferase MtaB [Acidobacteriales bacterium]|nr:tRNA (N(6)-L-threonylcarbamoyladenosine(37)-C(2))-methylthiotransferase MtaB [Terriglobales bacterium]
MGRRFYIQNFGCRATQADGAAIERALGVEGLVAAPDVESADIVVLNSCTVTAAADEDLRHALNRVHRRNPEASILVTGCYAQRRPEELIGFPGVKWVVGNSHKHNIPQLVQVGEGVPSHGLIQVGDIAAEQQFMAAPVDDASGDRTRPNLKIQDGCGNRCTFCVIPSVRGRSRSAEADWVVEEVRKLAATHAEVVLSGINLGRWGREHGGRFRLVDLLRRLFDETDVRRLRLSSVEPMDWSGDLLDLVASSSRMAQHVHIPLQSGSDSVLRRMRRRYRPRHYEERVRLARTLMPDAAIGADVMVGFPGESEAEFEESRSFIESLPFTYLHVFTYSVRPGTPAAGMPQQVPVPVRKNRNRILRELAAAKNLEFRRKMVGRTLSAVTLNEPGTAITGNYLKVSLAAPREPNRIVDLAIGGLASDGLLEAGETAI